MTAEKVEGNLNKSTHGENGFNRQEFKNQCGCT